MPLTSIVDSLALARKRAAELNQSIYIWRSGAFLCQSARFPVNVPMGKVVEIHPTKRMAFVVRTLKRALL
jgi:hypothetical protein